MKADLERKVHELLDAGRDPAQDPEIRSAIADDEEARREVAALSKLDHWLRDWEVGVPEEDLEPIALRIEQRLDEPLGSFDATAPPEFEDPDAKVASLGGDRGAVRSGEYSLDALAGAVAAPAPAQMTGPSPAVSLSAPPRREPSPRPIAPWIAAAAVVALGVTVSVATLNRADEPAAESQAAPTAAEALPGMFPTSPAEAPTMPELPEMEAAEEAAAGAMAEAMDDEAAVEGAHAEPEPTASGGASPRRRATGRGLAPMAPAAPASAMATATARQGGQVVDAVGGAGGNAFAAEQEERQEAVERSKAGVRACLGASADSAVVMVRFRDGAVRDARLVRPAGNDATNECVASALRRARIRPQGAQERRTLYYRWGSRPVNAYQR